MKRRLKIFLIVLVALLAALAIVALIERRPVELAWAKASARRALNRLSPEVRRNLNVVPMEVDLPPLSADQARAQVVELGDFAIQVLQPDSWSEQKKTILLTYPRYQARILVPHALAPKDAAAKQLGFKSMFDLESAIFHTRLDDLDRQPDLPSLKRCVMLLSQKVSETYVREQFRCNELRGFIINPIPGTKRTVVEVFDPSQQVTFGVWITDEGDQSDTDVHQFLQVLRVKPKQPALGKTTTGTLPTSGR